MNKEEALTNILSRLSQDVITQIEAKNEILVLFDGDLNYNTPIEYTGEMPDDDDSIVVLSK